MKKGWAILLSTVIVGGIFFTHPAFAHNFVQLPDADLIAKIQEFKAETRLIVSNASNGTNAQWHISKSQQYWGTKEMGLLDQKNSSLAGQLSNSMSDFYSSVTQQNPDPVVTNQKAGVVDHLVDLAESELVNNSSQNNATIQALAVVDVLNETLKDYGTAVGSSVDLTNMDNMNMSATSSSGNNMQGMAGMSGMSSTPVVNMAAYQSAQALAGTAQTMFGNLQSDAPSNAAPYLAKAGSALNDLKQKIDAKGSGNDIMTVVHMQIHPNLIAGFNIEAVPEFPVPLLLAVISFFGLISVSKFIYRK